MTTTAPRQPPPRRTQEERRTATRARLLESAIACLHAKGYAATTVSEVQEHAGLARGTLLHHFPTKSELMVAATAQLVNDRIELMQRAAAELPPDCDRLNALTELAWADLNSQAFFTALELWVAARTDDQLRDALIAAEKRMFRQVQTTFEAVLGPEYADDPRAATLVELTIDVLTGLTMTTLVTGKLGPREQMIGRWQQALRILFGQADADTLMG